MAKQSTLTYPASRPEAMKKVAAELQMEFQAKDEWGLLRQLSDFRLFRRGMSRTISNHLKNRDDMLETSLHLFDYRFTVNSGKSAITYNQSVFFVDSKKLGLPQFRMKPENFLHYLGNLLGFKDIDFEEYPKFSNNYYLKGEDEDYVRASLPSQFFRFFSEEKEWYLEGVNYYLILYRVGHLLPPRELRAFYEKGVVLHRILTETS